MYKHGLMHHSTSVLIENTKLLKRHIILKKNGNLF